MGIHGNEFVIKLEHWQYDEFGDYWNNVAEGRAKATKQEVVIIVDGKVQYRSTEHEQGKDDEQ